MRMPFRTFHRIRVHKESMPTEIERSSNPNGETPGSMCGQLVRAGTLVDLRQHLPAHRETFVRWYQDAEIAEMLRHDLTPLHPVRARGYFDSIILPASARGTCWAIHVHQTGRLIGSTAVTDVDERAGTSMFRLVIGEKSTWGQGYGTEATGLVLDEAFETLGLVRVNLEVFTHNPRAYRTYEKSGFTRTGQHEEWVASMQRWINIVEMSIDRDRWMRFR